jgi:hypothetical protein
MQISTYFLAFLLLVLLSSCINQSVTPKPPPTYSSGYWGTASAQRNGKELQNPRIWAVTRTACNAHAFDVFITEFTDQGEEVVTFNFVNVPQRVGTLNRFKPDYKNLFCTTDTVGSTLTAKIRAGFSGTYKPRSWGNQLIITSFDTVTKEIKGTFFLRMNVDERLSATGPDSINIRRGEFHTKLRGVGGKYE